LVIVEPGEIRNLLIAFFAAAMVIASGVVYAVLITLARRALRGGAFLLWGAAAAYLALAGFVGILAWAANLRGPWLILVFLMLAGYLFAPRAILRLCEGTHALEEGGDGK
jgi:hypothetical protein